MRPAFIIMQIGNEELDRVAASAIVPALSAVGFDAKRVDKHNKGDLLKSEIINFIHESELIVADLTNERPNCYLEVGFVMGVNKFANLILTVREDHFPDSPNYKPGGPKVHFDLAGYDILPWKLEDLDSFRSELEKRVRRRLELLDTESSSSKRSGGSDESLWHLMQRDAAADGLKRTRFSAFMDVTFAPASRIADISLPKLNHAARVARIQTFGWPIAPYIDKDGFRPRPTKHGIVA